MPEAKKRLGILPKQFTRPSWIDNAIFLAMERGEKRINKNAFTIASQMYSERGQVDFIVKDSRGVGANNFAILTFSLESWLALTEDDKVYYTAGAIIQFNRKRRFAIKKAKQAVHDAKKIVSRDNK